MQIVRQPNWSYVVFEVDQQETSGQLHRHANDQQEDVLQQETDGSAEVLVTPHQQMFVKPSVDIIPKALNIVLGFLVWSCCLKGVHATHWCELSGLVAKMWEKYIKPIQTTGKGQEKVYQEGLFRF